MPSGTASRGTKANASRDSLDAAIGRVLRRRPPLAPPRISLTDEQLLGYIEGTLDDEARACLERHLLSDSHARHLVCLLGSAVREHEARAGTGSPPEGPAHFVFGSSGGRLRFLRGTTWPEASHDPASDFPSFKFFHPLAPAQLQIVVSSSPGTLNLDLCLKQEARRCQVRILRGQEGVLQAEMDGAGLHVPGLPLCRHEIEIFLGEDPPARLVLDVRDL